MSTGTASYGPQFAVDNDAVLRRERLVMEHLAQVRIIAGRIHDRLPDIDDVQQYVFCNNS